MDEWAKTLLSSGCGFVAGLAAEPVKFSLVRSLKRHQVKEAIYSELGLAYHRLNRSCDLGHGPGDALTEQQMKDRAQARQLFESVSTRVFDHYSDEERTAFLEVDEREAFERLYALIGTLPTKNEWAERDAAIRAVFQLFERLFREGSLDMKKLLRWRAKHRQTTFDRIDHYYANTDSDVLIRDSRP